MSLERSLSDALDGLAPEPPSALLPGEVETKARRRVRRQRVLAAAGTAAVVALASVTVANFQPGAGRSPHPASTTGAEPSDTPRTPTVIAKFVELTPPNRLGPSWVQDVLIGYGSATDHVGLDSSSRSCSAGCGPTSAAPSQTGTWWVADVVKSRLVEFAVDGQVRRVVPLPLEAQGVEQIRVLDDETLVGDRGGQLLVVRGDAVTVVKGSDGTDANPSVVVGDDGFSVFTEDSRHVIHRVGIGEDGLTDEVASATLRDGTPYSAAVDGNAINVTFGSPPTRALQVTPTTPDGPLKYLAFSQAVDADGLILLIVGSSDRRSGLTRLVRVDRTGTVTDEPAPDPFPAAQSSFPALRTTADGVTTLSWADGQGMHLYHRVSQRLVKPPPPVLDRVQSASPLPPAAGICSTAASGGADASVSVTVGRDGVPEPRCLRIAGSAVLSVSNASWFTRYVRLGRHELALGPGETRAFPEPLHRFLAPGWHHVLVYGNAGGFALEVR